jgi:hypothetical protein
MASTTRSRRDDRLRTGWAPGPHRPLHGCGVRKENTMPGSRTAAGTTRRKSTSPRTRDPRGGLTAAGRREFKRKDGANLRPGVKKPMAEMTPLDMRRKGSWAVRFYGRRSLPPLVDEQGRPTRFALSAAAWGEPVPRTERAARAIAAKGRRLLERAKRASAAGKSGT